jgi:hypothetical protein
LLMVLGLADFGSHLVDERGDGESLLCGLAGDAEQVTDGLPAYLSEPQPEHDLLLLLIETFP